MTSLENHEGNIEHLSEKMTHANGRDSREWRRSLVLELDSQGYTHREIVAKLQISKGTVSNDLSYLESRPRIIFNIIFMKQSLNIIRNVSGV